MTFRDEALKLVTDNGYKDLCELGVWRGELSRMLAKVAQSLTLVDPWDVRWNQRYPCTMGEPEKTQEDLNKMYADLVRDLPGARILCMPSLQAADFVPDKSLDFIFIDSVHDYDYCLAEIKAWLPKIRPFGMMAGDDYVPEHKAVARAVDEVFGFRRRNNVWIEKV